MSSPNGTPIVLKDRAQALAHYPHGRIINGMIYVSGISSRRLDNTYEGVHENPDGTLTLDIKEQTKAVIEKYDEEKKKVYNQYFDAATGPARTCVGVLSLPSPKLLIEIKAIAKAP
ncbi:hypothetical protein BGZ94_002678 [Podila epigama]|nr:hypothetical protein BGZ94_002678 [Podila epigama]